MAVCQRWVNFVGNKAITITNFGIWALGGVVGRLQVQVAGGRWQAKRLFGPVKIIPFESLHF